VADVSFNRLNAWTKRTVVDGLIPKLSRFFEGAPSQFLCLLMTPFWKFRGLSAEEIEARSEALFLQGRRGTFPIGITACLAVVLLALLFLL
jgi:hypothetical protein